MKISLPAYRVSPLLMVVFFLLSASLNSAFAQVNAVTATHITDNQNQITVRLDNPLGALYNTNVGWTVTVGGVGATVNTVVGAALGTVVTITLTDPGGGAGVAPEAIGIGQAVVVNFAGDGAINPIVNLASTNNRAIACSDFQFAANIGNTPPCAPVDPNTVMVFSVKPAARNSSLWNLADVRNTVYWRTDLVAPFSFLPVYESTIAGAAAANAYFVAYNSASDPGNFVYPGTEANCGYTSFWHVRIVGVGTCPATDANQQVIYRSFNGDSGDGDGQIATQPTVANTDQVCEGQLVNMSFSDVSDLNCIDDAAAPAPLPNNEADRWVRVIYGFPHAAGGTIRNVFVGAQQVTDGNGDLLPAFVAGGYVPLTANALGTPDGFGVVNFPAIVTNPNNDLETITTSTATLEGDVGRTFNITLQYWNVCNSYSTGIFTNAKEITDQVIVINAPIAPTAASRDICSGESRALSVTNAGFTYRWYSTSADAVAQTNSLDTAVTFTPTTVQAPAGQRRHFFVTATTGNGCVSPPTEVTLTRRTALSQPAVITGPINLCPATDYIYTLPTDPPVITITDATTGNFTLATEYFWTVPTGWTIVSGQGTKSLTVTSAGTAAAGNITVINRYVDLTSNTTLCGGTSRTLAVNVRARPTVGITPDPVNICQGSSLQLNGNPVLPPTAAGFTPTISLHTWGGSTAILDDATIQQPTVQAATAPSLYNVTYVVTADFGSSVSCSSTTDNVDVNISTNPPTANAGTDQPLCQVSLTSNVIGASNPAPGTGTWTVQTKPIGSNVVFNGGVNDRNATITVDQNGAYTLRWTVVNGACSSFDDVVIDFGTDPGVQNAGTDNAFCGLSGSLNATAPTVGSISWAQFSGPGGGTTTFTPASPTTVNPGITVTVAGTYVYRMTVLSGTCTPRTDDVQIVFNQVAVSSPAANFTTCVDPLLLGAINITGTVSGGATGGRWEVVSGGGVIGSSGTTTGSNILGVSPTALPDTYIPVAADIAAGSVQVRLVATGACAEVSVTRTITLDRRPTGIDAGAFQLLVCANPGTGLGNTSLTATALNVTPAETGAWSGPGGVTFGTGTNPSSTVASLPGGAKTTLTWTVRSNLFASVGGCAAVSDTVSIRVNVLPAALNPTPTNLCEVVESSGVALDINITQYNDGVTGIIGSGGRTVEWYTTAARTPMVAVPDVTQHDISNGMTLFTRVYNTATNCFRDGIVTFTVNPLPIAADRTFQFCEEFPAGSNQVQNINLTAATILDPITGIVGSVGRTVVWFHTLADANSNTNAIPNGTATSYDVLLGSEVLFARVTHNTTTCVNVAQVNLDVKSRPNDPIIGSGSENQCLGNFDLYTVTPVGGATYIWDVDDGPGEFDVIAGGALNDFLIVVGFPNIFIGEIRVKLELNGCESHQDTLSVEVLATPPDVVITASKHPVCENDTGIKYTATDLPSTDYTWSIPVLGGATGTSIIGGQGSKEITVNIGTVSGNIVVTPQTVGGLCSGDDATFFIDVRERPVLDTYTITNVCSDDAIGIVLQEETGSVVPASYRITNVTVAPGLNPSSRALATGGSGLIALDSYTNVGNGNTPLDVRYTIIPISVEGCEGSPKDIVVRIRPEPVVNPNLDKTVCSREVANIVLQVSSNSAPANEFEITSIDFGGLVAVGGSPTTGTGFLANEIANDIWENTTGVRDTVKYFVRPVNTTTGCIGDPPYPVLLIVNPEPQITSPTADIICSGDMPGITLTSSIGGSFDWTVKSITGTITGGNSGSGNTINNVLINGDLTSSSITYEVVATGPGGAFGTCPSQPVDVTITVNPAPTANSVDQIVCSDASGGNTFIEDLQSLENAVNSTGTVTFAWYQDLAKTLPINAPQVNAWPLANGIPVYVDVFNGQCRILKPVTYTVNPTPLVSASITSTFVGGNHVSCAGASNGQVTSAVATLGTPNYLYSIDGGTSYFTSRVFNGLSALGNPYVITVRDSKGCTATSGSMTLIEPAALTATTAITSSYNLRDISCPGEDDGQITVSPLGGVAPFTYQILELPSNTTGNANGIYTTLKQGTYTVVVRDANLCQVTSNSVSPVDPPMIVATATLDNQVICNGQSNGQFTVVASGGTVVTSFDYTLVQAPFTTNNTGVFAGRAAAPYSVRVEDDNGCSQVSNTITVTQPSVLTAFASVTSNYNGAKISCPGANDAEITVVANGGNGGYTYVLVQAMANTSGNSDGTYNLVGPGTYTVAVQDALACPVTTTAVTFSEPTPINASGLVSSAISCNGSSDGQITISGTGGTGAYSFEQITPVGPTNANGIFSALPQGVYDFEVSDLNGCSDGIQVTLNQPAIVVANSLVTSDYNGSDISCTASSDGAITVTAVGGTGAYTYVFDQISGNTTGSTSGVFIGIPGGNNYTFTVQDAKGCSDQSAPVNIDVPTAVTITSGAVTSNYNGQDISCTGQSDAVITIVATGGTILAPGQYTFRLDQEPLNTSGNASGVYVGVNIGSYTVTVRDVNNCFVITVPITVDPYPAITVPASVLVPYNGGRQISCNGANDGSITTSPTGGVGPYDFTISGPTINTTGDGPGMTSTYTNLSAGNYQVTVEDMNGCPKTTSSLIILQPDALLASAQVTSNYNGEHIRCFNTSDGIIKVTATGGTTAYSYVLNQMMGNLSGATSGTFTGVPENPAYTITVTDVNLCSITTTPIPVVAPLPLVVDGNVTTDYNGQDISCNGANDAIITVTSTPGTGTGTVTYAFDIYPAPGNVTGKFSGVFSNVRPNPAPGGYTITGTDANGCTAQTLVITVDEPTALSGTAASTLNPTYNGFGVSCFNETDGQITVTPAGGTGNPFVDFNYVLLEASGNLTGATDAIFDDLRAGSYRVRITDLNGCIFTTTAAIVSTPADIKIDIDITSSYGAFGTDISCTDAADGEVSVLTTIFGGAGLVGGGAGLGIADYTYVLTQDLGNTSGNALGIFTGLTNDIAYTITATDANGCTKESLPKVLIEPIPLYEGYVGSDQNICRAQTNPGAFTIVTPVFGGNGSYQYQWQESSSIGGPFTDIGGATSDVFTAPAPVLTRFYRRVVNTGDASGSCPLMPTNVLTITVNDLPTASIENQAAVCEGSPFLLDFTFTGSAPFNFTYNDGVNAPVSRIGGSVTPIFIPDYQDQLTYSITSLVDGKGCIADPLVSPVASYTVPIIKVDADFTITSPNPQCSGSLFSFAYTANPGVEYKFLWPDGLISVLTPGTGTIDKILSTFNSETNSDLPVVFTAKHPLCTSITTSQLITIYPAIVPNIVTTPTTMCSGTQIVVTNLTQGGDDHDWRIVRVSDGVEVHSLLNQADGNSQIFTINNNLEPALNPETYEIRYSINNTLANGACSDQRIVPVRVYREVNASFVKPPQPSIPLWAAMGVDVAFPLSPGISTAADFQYSWTYISDAAPNAFVGTTPPTIHYSAPGLNKRTRLVATNPAALADPLLLNACQDVDEYVFDIYIPALSADFQYTPEGACLPTTIVITSNVATGDRHLWVVRDQNGDDIYTSGEVTPSFSITSAGEYEVYLTTSSSLSAATPVTVGPKVVSVYANPDAIFNARPKTLFVPDQELSTFNDSETALNALDLTEYPIIYKWYFGDGTDTLSTTLLDPLTNFSPTHKYLNEGNYDVALVAINEHAGGVVCADTAVIRVQAKAEGFTRVPNAFSPSTNGPNGGISDGSDRTMNDVFLPITKGVKEFQMQIFDRWGNLVFESKETNRGWDGYDKNGILMPAGVYVYKLVLRLANDQRTTQVGDVTLIR